MSYNDGMKRLIIFVALLIAVLLLSGCCYSQYELDDAYNEGYAQGYSEGYIQGNSDCLVYDGPYVGSVNSDVYHYPWCIAAQNILPENEVWFSSVEEAQAAGYRPCQICNPP